MSLGLTIPQSLLVRTEEVVQWLAVFAQLSIAAGLNDWFRQIPSEQSNDRSWPIGDVGEGPILADLRRPVDDANRPIAVLGVARQRTFAINQSTTKDPVSVLAQRMRSPRGDKFSSAGRLIQ